MGEESLKWPRSTSTTTINGAPTEFLCDANQTLLDVLRDKLGLTGSKEGCGSGDCGACSVMVDGRLVCSCLVLAPEAEGAKVETIEGMAEGDKLHPLQQKFLEHAALQCGICTPGFLVAAKALLEKTPNPTETEVRYWLAGNLCRCTGYDKIVTRGPRRGRRNERSLTDAATGPNASRQVQVDRHAPRSSRRRRQGDRPRPLRRRLQPARPADRQGAAQPARRTPRIKSIDTSKAEALPGVKAVVTRKDFPEQPNLIVPTGEMQVNMRDVTRNVMAREKALYEGHAVAAVAAIVARRSPSRR